MPTTITVDELREVLSKVKGAQPIAFSALTLCDARKTGARLAGHSLDGTPMFEKIENPHYGMIWKLSRVQAFTSVNYESSVNRQRTREGVEQPFEAKERTWGERVCAALIRHYAKNGKESYYLVAQVLRAKSPIYLVQNNGFPLCPISKDIIAPFLPVKKVNEAQGVDKEIIYRNYLLENITSLSLDREVFRIRDRHTA